MKSIFKLCTVLALAAATFSQHTTALAGDIFVLQSRGKLTSSFFSSLDPSGCIATDVSALGGDLFSHQIPGPPDPFSAAFVVISQYNFCTETQLLDAGGFALSLGDGDFQARNDLTSATLTTTVNVYDSVSDSFFDVFVDLAWTGTGPLDRFHGKGHYQDPPGCITYEHFNSTSRSTEVSGSVSDGTTNFTPEAGDGIIFSSKRGAVQFGGINCQ